VVGRTLPNDDGWPQSGTGTQRELIEATFRARNFLPTASWSLARSGPSGIILANGFSATGEPVSPHFGMNAFCAS